MAAELRPQDGLAAGLALGALVLAPLFAWRTGRVFDDAGIAGRTVVVGLASSVVPYALEQLAMRRLPRHRFAVMLALLPVDRDRDGRGRARPGALGRPTPSGSCS